MRILIVENVDGTDIGRMAKTFSERQVALDILKAFAEMAIPATPDGYDGLIVLGGPQDALDDAACPYYPALLELMRRFDKENKPVLGICLGSQLLARAHGGENILAQPIEFGYAALTPTGAGREDPVMSIVDPAVPIFQWHSDTFSLPPGAELLVTGSAFENQGYRVGNASYGSQFHFEVNRELALRWSSSAEAHLDECVPGWRTDLPAALDRHEPDACAFCDTITGRWIDYVATKIAERVVPAEA